MKKKRSWQIVALLVTIIGIILIMTLSNISTIIPAWTWILYVILGMLLIVIGSVSCAILEFYY